MKQMTENQRHNCLNPSQGETKRVLTVCSAGLLRSATLQQILIKDYNYNVRNCGTEESYALIPLTEALIYWADEIVFVEHYNFKVSKIEDMIENPFLFRTRTTVIVLDVDDIYNFNSPKLVNILKYQYDYMQKHIAKQKELDINDRIWIYDSTNIPVE